MFRIETYIMYSLIAWNLCGCQSESQDNARSVCLLQDPPNQCGEFCLSVLEPLLGHIAKHQGQWNTSDALQLNDTQAKLDRIQTKLDWQAISLGDTLKKVLTQDFQDKLTMQFNYLANVRCIQFIPLSTPLGYIRRYI